MLPISQTPEARKKSKDFSSRKKSGKFKERFPLTEKKLNFNSIVVSNPKTINYISNNEPIEITPSEITFKDI